MWAILHQLHCTAALVLQNSLLELTSLVLYSKLYSTVRHRI